MTFQIDLAQLLELADVELTPWTNINEVDSALRELADEGVKIILDTELRPSNGGIKVEYTQTQIPKGSIVKFHISHYDYECNGWDDDAITSFQIEGVLTIH